MQETKTIKSASIILQRSTGEVFLAKRSSTVSFFPNFWVFPGGKIEEPLPATWEGTEFEVIETIYKELYEEVGIVVGSDYIIPPHERKQSFLVQHYNDDKRKEFRSQMMYVGKKDTPPFRNKIYSAAYFHIRGELVDELSPEVDNGELVEGEWIQPQKAIEDWKKGKKLLPPPILQLLRNIQSDYFESITLSETFLPIGLQTKIEFAPEFQLIPIASNTIDPFSNTNLVVIGDTNPIIVDPGANEEGKEHLKQIILSLDATPTVVLTHHHNDHWEGLDVIAEVYPDAVVKGHKETLNLISTDLQTQSVSEGEILKFGENKSIEVIHLPGHTHGSIGLFDSNHGVLIAGDHVVGYGSAVLDPKTGSMIDYFASTNKLLGLDLQLILPAHGPPNFSPVKLLKQYLRHRMKREEDILKAVQEGHHTLDEIVKVVYTDVPEKMWDFAKRNIQLHLEKLDEDGKLPTDLEY